MKQGILILILTGLLACSKDDDLIPLMEINHTFNVDTEGWTSVFADYPVAQESIYGLQFIHSPLPQPLDENQGAVMLSGNNHSDDLFMGMKRKITGLNPGEEYGIHFKLVIASNVADNMVGVGGSPGESVYIKAGASSVEPLPVLDQDKWYRLNIDKGNQAEEGENMFVVGNFANGTDNNQYTLKTLNSAQMLKVVANENGELWIIVGTDSGFESNTTIYFNTVTIEIF